MRPGRLDRLLYVGPPDHAARLEILEIRMNSMAVEPNIDMESLAQLVRTTGRTPCRYLVAYLFHQTEGCSGAEITALCQEAAILTMQQDINAPYVSASDRSLRPFTYD